MSSQLVKQEYAQIAERLEKAKCSKGTDFMEFINTLGFDQDEIDTLVEELEVLEHLKIKEQSK